MVSSPWPTASVPLSHIMGSLRWKITSLAEAQGSLRTITPHTLGEGSFWEDGFTRSYRIHCFQKRQNLLPRRRKDFEDDHPTHPERAYFLGVWILRLRLRLRAEWQGGRHTAKSDSFRTMKTNRKEIWCRIDWLGWCCVHRFWIDPVPIVFGMMLWELVLEWSFSYWLLIDVCIGFGLMLCKLVFNWFMSLIKNKVSSFLKFVAAHFIELDSSSNLSPHPPVILHAGLARSCRIHCFNLSSNPI